MYIQMYTKVVVFLLFETTELRCSLCDAVPFAGSTEATLAEADQARLTVFSVILRGGNTSAL